MFGSPPRPILRDDEGGEEFMDPVEGEAPEVDPPSDEEGSDRHHGEPHDDETIADTGIENPEPEANPGVADAEFVRDPMEVLNHVLVNVFGNGREPKEGEPAHGLVGFVVMNSINDVRTLLTLTVSEMQALGYQPHFSIVKSLAALNMWYHEDDVANRSDIYEYGWFMHLTKNALLKKEMVYGRVTSIPSPTDHPELDTTGTSATPPVIEIADTPAPVRGNHKASLEAARSRRSSMSVYTGNSGGGGRPPRPSLIAPKPTVGRVSFAPTATIHTAAPTAATTNAAPTAVTPQVAAPTAVHAPYPTLVSQGVPTAPSTHYVLTRTQEFEKGGRRSSSDYPKLASREQWPKWHRALLGNAMEHKCEQVLNTSYVPDPTDMDEVELFKCQQRFMFSVFSKTLTEGKATDILREYSDPKVPQKFGDAQRIYADLVDFYEGTAMTRVSAASIDTKLTTLRLNKLWTKTVSTFIITVSHLIRDHKEATAGIQPDHYYIEKLNATLSEHKDMSTHIQNLATQESMIQRRMGAHVAPITYEDHLRELTEYATLLDD